MIVYNYVLSDNVVAKCIYACIIVVAVFLSQLCIEFLGPVGVIW